MLLENQGRRWLPEDCLNLVEMIDEGRSWTYCAHMLGRSENACRLAYGKIRFANRLRGTFLRKWSKIEMGRVIVQD